MAGKVSYVENHEGVAAMVDGAEVFRLITDDLGCVEVWDVRPGAPESDEPLLVFAYMMDARLALSLKYDVA